MDENHKLGFTKIADNPKILEATFKECLDIFHSNATKAIQNQDTTAYTRYLSVVRSEYTRVDVVDSNGDFLFWVPPLRYKPDMEDVDYYAIIKKSDAVARRSKIQADAMSAEMASSILKEPTVPDEDSDQWKKILTRYGLSGGKGMAMDTSSNEDPVDTLDVSMEDDDEW